jgi:hypothetical protein
MLTENRMHPYSHSHSYLLFSVSRLEVDCPGVDALPSDVLSDSGDKRTSRTTSRSTIANRKLAESPHISTPVRLSTDPIVRQLCGRRRSPEPTVE